MTLTTHKSHTPELRIQADKTSEETLELQPCHLQKSGTVRVALAMLLTIAGSTCIVTGGTEDEGGDTIEEDGVESNHPPGYEAFGLPRGICLLVDGESGFDNLHFVEGEPYAGVAFDQLGAGRVRIQAAPESHWKVLGVETTEGPYVEGILERGNITGILSDGGVTFAGLHNEYAGRLIALDGSVVPHGTDGSALTLTLEDSDDPAFDQPNRTHFTGGPFIAHGLILAPDSAKFERFREKSDENNWTIPACDAMYRDGLLGDF